MEDFKLLVNNILMSGLTQKELADMLGVSQGHVSKLARGIPLRISYELGTGIKKTYKNTILKKQ